MVGLGELLQAQGIGDDRARDAIVVGGLLLSPAKVVDGALDGAGLLPGGQVATFFVSDQADLFMSWSLSTARRTGIRL